MQGLTDELLAQELGLWTYVNEIPSISPGIGIKLVEIRNKVGEALENVPIPQELGLARDIKDYIKALDLVCQVAAVQQKEVIDRLERVLTASRHDTGEEET